MEDEVEGAVVLVVRAQAKARARAGADQSQVQPLLGQIQHLEHAILALGLYQFPLVIDTEIALTAEVMRPDVDLQSLGDGGCGPVFLARLTLQARLRQGPPFGARQIGVGAGADRQATRWGPAAPLAFRPQPVGIPLEATDGLDVQERAQNRRRIAGDVLQVERADLGAVGVVVDVLGRPAVDQASMICPAPCSNAVSTGPSRSAFNRSPSTAQW